MIMIKTRAAVKYERQTLKNKKKLPISFSHENGFYLVNPYSNYTKTFIVSTGLTTKIHLFTSRLPRFRDQERGCWIIKIQKLLWNRINAARIKGVAS